MTRPDPDPETHIAALAALRAARGEGALGTGVEFAPGIAFHADPGLGLSGRYSSPAGRLLELSARISGVGDWAALHIALDLPDLGGLGWIGFACRTAAPREVMIRPCLRTGEEGGFADRFFPKHILSGPEVRGHLDAFDLAEVPELPRAAPWRELVLFCPRTDFDWHLHDLRVFAA